MTNIGSVLVRGGTVCDPAAGHARQADVLIQDGIIQEVGPELPPPSGVRIVEAAGGYVIPGLIDAHVHVTAGTADLGSSSDASPFYVAAQTQAILGGMLRRGFTTVRDMGGADFGVAQAVADGLWEGPRVFFGGKALSPTGGHADLRGPGRSLLAQHGCGPTIGRVGDGVDAVRTGARDQFRTGADHIKVMLSGGVASPTDRIDSLQFSDDDVRAVVEEARNANRYVAGHAYTARAVNRGVRLGVRTIEHGNLIDDESVQLLVEHHQQQLGLGGGVAEHRAVGHVGGDGDLLGGGAGVALLGEQAGRGRRDAASLLGLVALAAPQHPHVGHGPSVPDC